MARGGVVFPPKAGPPLAEAAPAGPAEKMPFLNRDSVKLFYTDSGSGEPPLLFVHGWACDHSHWRRQIPVFRRRHRVVAVDLRGHGRSSKPRQEYTMEGFADDLAWLCRQIRLTKPVVVGHSMGGGIALVLATRHRDLPRAIVLVDAPVAPPPRERQALLSRVPEMLEAPSYRKVAAGFIDRMFTPAFDLELKVHVRDKMLATPQHVMASALRHMLNSECHRLAPQVAVPAMLVTAPMSAADLSSDPALPGWIYGQVVGSGHFLHLEVPEQFNSMLRRFLEVMEAI